MATRKQIPLALYAFGFGIVLLAGRAAARDRARREEVAWQQDFETTDPFHFWVASGAHTVNFKGLTPEDPADGRMAFKLDVTFVEGGYAYWRIPVRIPAEGQLAFSGRLRLGTGTTGRAGLGFNLDLPPTSLSGCAPLEVLSGSSDEWRTIEADLSSAATDMAAVVSAKHVALGSANELGKVVDAIGVFLYGAPGQRVVAYVDELRLSGWTSPEPAYKQTVERRWAPAKSRIQRATAARREQVKGLKIRLSSLGDVATPGLERVVAELRARLTGLEGKLGSDTANDYLDLQDYLATADELRTFPAAIANLQGHIRKGTAFPNVLVYGIENPISGTATLPSTTLPRGTLAPGELSMSAALGEYESVSLVVRAIKDVKSMMLEGGDFRQEGGEAVIPASAIDIRAVKCWYQAGTAWDGVGQVKKVRKLVPELLLRDDRLVDVDTEAQTNHLRLKFPEGDRAVPISDARASTTGSTIRRPEDFPVRDADRLQPLDLAANLNKQYWITVRVPDHARPGVYRAIVRLTGNGSALAQLAVRLRVLPFRLPSPKTYYDESRDFTSSIYYRGVLGGIQDKAAAEAQLYPDGSVSSEYKSEHQLRAELQDMLAHNITNPTSYQGLAGLGSYLRIRNEVGMAGLPLFSLGVRTGSAQSSPELKALQQEVKELRAVAASYGTHEVFVYGVDEARGEALLAQRSAWQAVHEAGAKVFVAGYRGNFGTIGVRLDTLVQAGPLAPNEARRWHSIGHRLFSYANPQAGPENPEQFRRNYGLLLWRAEYDGAMTYAYQHSFGDIYNDFDDDTYRDAVFSYPTADGVIPTLAIEGYREGIDDIRYGTLLRSLIAAAKRAGGARADLAATAARYLASIGADADLAAVRHRMIDLVLGLRRAARPSRPEAITQDRRLDPQRFDRSEHAR